MREIPWKFKSRSTLRRRSSCEKPSRKSNTFIRTRRKTNIDEPHAASGRRNKQHFAVTKFQFSIFPIWSFSRLFFIFFRSRTVPPSDDVLCPTGGGLLLLLYGCLFSFYQFEGFKEERTESLLWNFYWEANFPLVCCRCLRFEGGKQSAKGKNELKYLLNEKCQAKVSSYIS